MELTAQPQVTDPQERAALAAQSVLTRHLATSFGLPFTATGISLWPYTFRERMVGAWNFWWQAHLIDSVLDAYQRTHSAEGKRLARRMIRTHYFLNGRCWRHNEYYDDVAWAALAVQRAKQLGVVGRYEKPLRWVEDRFLTHRDPEFAIPWRVGDEFWNTPANGPAAIFLARQGTHRTLEAAREIADWMHRTLVIEEGAYAGLYADGIVRKDGVVERRNFVFTYCQGVGMGAELELALRTTGEEQLEHCRRVTETVDAVQRVMLSPDGVLKAGGGGDGGLFKGILLRYLAQVALLLPDCGQDCERARRLATDIVAVSAEGAWNTAAWLSSGLLFSEKWTRPATLPLRVQPLVASSAGDGTADGSEPASSPASSVASKRSDTQLGAQSNVQSGDKPGTKETAKAQKIDGAVRSSEIAEQDMSTQLSGWMALEAAALLAREGLIARK